MLFLFSICVIWRLFLFNINFYKCFQHFHLRYSTGTATIFLFFPKRRFLIIIIIRQGTEQRACSTVWPAQRGCKVRLSESHSYYTRLALRQRTPGKAESDSYSVSSAVESLGPSNEHFDQHEQGRKYGTQQFREPLLQCDEHSVGERSGRASRIVTIRG